MGVRDLWKILSKAKRKVDIRELRGKTLAVDLSCWICQFSSVKGTIVQCHVCTTWTISFFCTIEVMKSMHIPEHDYFCTVIFVVVSQLTKESVLPYSSSLFCWSQPCLHYWGCCPFPCESEQWLHWKWEGKLYEESGRSTYKHHKYYYYNIGTLFCLIIILCVWFC